MDKNIFIPRVQTSKRAIANKNTINKRMVPKDSSGDLNLENQDHNWHPSNGCGQSKKNLERNCWRIWCKCCNYFSWQGREASQERSAEIDWKSAYMLIGRNNK